MCRVETNPALCWHPVPRACQAAAVPAPPACPTGGLNGYRLATRPAVLGLLGAPAGSVPHATSLAIGNAVHRAEHRAIEAALDAMADARPDYADLAAQQAKTCPAPEPEPEAWPRTRHAIPPEKRVIPGYTLERRKWPIGGLIDLLG